LLGMRRLHIAVVSTLGVALVAVGVLIFRQTRQLAEVRRQRDAALQSLRESQEALRKSELRIAESMQEKPAPENDGKAAIAKRDATIEQLTRNLNAAKTSITQLQEDLSTSRNEGTQALETSNQRLQEMRTDLQGRLDKLQQQLDSAQTELQSSRQHIAELQKANDQLSASNNEGAARASEREHILISLQDLDRRRESYLTSIADRYRNLTNQFRTMSGMLASNRGQDSGSFSGPALDMIQNAISLTDNDLQHLNELNAKAYRLEKQLSKK
jgi:chromosome segregation ATPase